MRASKKIYPTRKIINFVIGGGGWRTVYTKGVIDTLDQLKILNDIECVAATSGSCMAAYLLALGYDSRQSLEFLERHVLSGKFQIPMTFIPEHVDSGSRKFFSACA